jgi:VanZ family protein
MWGGQVFLYSRFENKRGEKWYNQFRPNKNIHQGEEYYITVIYGEGKKALYCDGKLIEEQAADFPLTRNEELCGRIIVGSSPFCKHGWMGEIRGIAFYDYALSSSEVSNHNKIFINHGVSALAGTQGLCGLYDFHAKNGNVVQNIAGAAPSLYIPEVYEPVKETIMHNQRCDMRIGKKWIYDSILNAFLFIPSGFLLTGFFSYMMSGRLAVLFFVSLVCAGISFGIEIAQIFIPSRNPSYYDVFANVLGAGTGAGVHLALSKIQIRE